MNEAKLSREEQVELGKKIAALVEKEVGSVFAADSNQGAGVIAILKIVAHKEDVTNKIKKFLRVDLGLALQNGKENHKNHGSGMKCTALVNLAEIRLDAVKRIENLHKLTCVEKVKPVVVKNVKSENKEVAQAAPVITDSAPKTETAIEKRKYSQRMQSGQMTLSLYISSLLSFGKMLDNGGEEPKDFSINDYFKYGKKTDDNFVTLSCIDEKIATSIEQLVCWLIGAEGVLRDEMDVTVDLSRMKNFENKKHYIQFTLPPKEGVTAANLKKMLLRVNSGAKPKKVIAHKTIPNVFVVSYVKKTTANTVKNIIVGMGWSVIESPENEGFIFINVGQNVPAVEKEAQVTPLNDVQAHNESNSSEELPSPPAIVFLPVEGENTQSKHLNNFVGTVPDQKPHASSYVFPGLQVNFFKKLQTKEEAYAELEKIYNDQALFSKLTEENQKQIVDILEEGYAQAHPNEYVEMLLKILK